MVHREAEEVAVGLRSDRRHPPRVRQQTDFAEVRPVRQRGRDFAVRHHDIDYAFLYEVHFRADCTLLNDDITCKYTRSNVTVLEREVILPRCFIRVDRKRVYDNRYLAGRLRI